MLDGRNQRLESDVPIGEHLFRGKRELRLVALGGTLWLHGMRNRDQHDGGRVA
jgi:hypothetical protein